MGPCLLLSLFLPSVLSCDTAVALPGRILSVTRSLMGNADVAVLATYLAQDVNTCIQECCIEKYGSCTIVSFKKTATDQNCQHFNCRPVAKCKYLSSNITDSFSFSSSPLPVPFRNASTSLSKTQTSTSFQTADQHTGAALYDQNMLRKSMKFSEEVIKSSIKARKGVSLDDTSSKVKPRKGVEPFNGTDYELSKSNLYFSKVGASVMPDAPTADNLVPVLKKVLEDDIQSTPSLKSSTSCIQMSDSALHLQSSFSMDHPTSVLPTVSIQNTGYLEATTIVPTMFDHSRTISSEADEKERKYKSSMHLVLSLVFGLVVLFTVLGVVAKRIYDGWVYRHYRRMDFLIEGMYNSS